MLGSILGILWSFGAIYFLYIAAKLSHWGWFVAGILIPPVPYVGILLYASGLIWQTQDAIDLRDPSKIAEARIYLSTFVKMQAKCAWEDFSEKDLRLARAEIAHIDTIMNSRSESVLAADRSSTAIAGTMRCDGPEHFGFVRMIEAIRSQAAH